MNLITILNQSLIFSVYINLKKVLSAKFQEMINMQKKHNKGLC